MPDARPSLPCPPMTISVELPADAGIDPTLAALPTAPGVFALEDGRGGTLALAVTANLRRLVRVRLAPASDTDKPSRRIDYRALARHVTALTVGSAFEADWAYLQHARIRLPNTYRSLLDRWRGWFVHCNSDAEFPRFVKTCTPGAAPTGRAGVYLGPFADKHAAARGIELLQGVFDLCRYHHILVEAPNASACAYKEMGRCPAPCDGSIPMDSYRWMIRGAIEFASTPHDQWRAEVEAEMRRAGVDLDFERAERLKQRLEAASDFQKPAFRFVDRLDRFRFLGVMPSERPGSARLLLVNGGWIEPFADVPLRASTADLPVLAEAMNARFREPAPALTEDAVQNIGLICRLLFRPRKAKTPGELLPVRSEVDCDGLAGALKRLKRSGHAASADEAAPGIAENEIESAG